MQSKKHSMLETAASTFIGLAVAFATQVIVFPWFGLHPSLGDNLGLTAIFTSVSIIRGYFVRRLFNRLHTKGIL